MQDPLDGAVPVTKREHMRLVKGRGVLIDPDTHAVIEFFTNPSSAEERLAARDAEREHNRRIHDTARHITTWCPLCGEPIDDEDDDH